MWVGDQWNLPSRTDHYLMQVAAEVLRTTLKPGHRDKVTTGMFKIPFVDQQGGTTSRPLTPQRRGGPPVTTKETIINFNKSRWLSQVSTPPVKE